MQLCVRLSANLNAQPSATNKRLSALKDILFRPFAEPSVIDELPQQSQLVNSEGYVGSARKDQHGAQIHKKPPKSTSGTGLGRASRKKQAIIKSVQYLFCF